MGTYDVLICRMSENLEHDLYNYITRFHDTVADSNIGGRCDIDAISVRAVMRGDYVKP